MDYARPQLCDRLAREYVLGTLRGPARRRFDALLLAHPGLRSAVADWQRRLGPLSDTIPPVEPPAGVWAAIEARLFGAERAVAPQGWRRLGWWQAWAASTTVAALVLGVLAVNPGPDPVPLAIVLGGPQTPGTFVASVSADGASLVLTPVNRLDIAPQRALELWSVPANGAPRSLGVVASDRATVLQRTRVDRSTDALALSVEPPGGSPTGQPTGPIVSVGKLRL